MKEMVITITLTCIFTSCNLYSEEAGKAAEAFCECSENRDFTSKDVAAYNKWITCLLDHSDYTDFYGIKGLSDFNKVNTEEEKTYELYSAMEEKCPEILDKVHKIHP